MNATPSHPNTKKLIIIRGRGTANEQRIETDVTLYRHRATGRWMTIPEGGWLAHSTTHPSSS